MGCGGSKSVDVAGSSKQESSLDSQLLAAAKDGKMALCRTLVPSGAKVGLQDDLGNTALHYLCACNRVTKEDLSSFVALGCFSFEDVDKKNHDGLTSFLCAAKDGNSDLLEYLCQEIFPLSVREEDRRKNNALHLAVLSGNKLSVLVMLNAWCKSTLIVGENRDGETPLAIAQRLLAEYQGDNPEQILESDDIREYNVEALREIIQLLYEQTVAAELRKDLLWPPVSVPASFLPRPGASTSTPTMAELLRAKLKKSEQSLFFSRPTTSAGVRGGPTSRGSPLGKASSAPGF